MKPCDFCDAMFRDQYNLERHMRVMHPEEMGNESEEDMDVDSESGDEEMVYDKNGRKRCRDIFDNDEEEEMDVSDNESDESEDSESEESMQPETDCMINNVLSELEDDKQAVEDYLLDQGRDDAEQEAYRQLLPKYRKQFRANLTETLERMIQLRKEPIYKLVMDTAKDLRSDGLGYKESIRAAISKRKHKINEYIPDELEDASDADDEEEDMQDWS